MSKKLIFMGGMALMLLTQSVFSAEKAKLFYKAANLQCLDRKVELQADCFGDDSMSLSCTSQSLSFTDGTNGKKINNHIFKAAPKKANEDYPVVAEQVGAIECVKTPANEKYVVTMLSNGGNCEECEWQEIYSWDGSYAGSSRDKNKRDEIKAIFKAVNNKNSKTFGKMEVGSFYQMKSVSVASISTAKDVPVARSDFQCHLSHGKLSENDMEMVSSELMKSLELAFGTQWSSQKITNKQISASSMSVIAKIAGCAAVYDKENSCATFYDPEFSGTLGVFTMLPRNAPLRRQFDDAINVLPEGREKAAAQHCMKLVAQK